MKILLNIFSAIITYLLSYLCFYGVLFFLMFNVSIGFNSAGDNSGGGFILLLGIGYFAFMLKISYLIISSYHEKISDYVDSNYPVDLGMTIDIFIFFASLLAFGFCMDFFLTLAIPALVAIITIILLYRLGVFIMKKVYKNYMKNHPIQFDNLDGIEKNI